MTAAHGATRLHGEMLRRYYCLRYNGGTMLTGRHTFVKDRSGGAQL